MNDMSRPQARRSNHQPNSALRLSEDIGDVLSAIRRLIAEDEALDYARNSLQRSSVDAPSDDVGQVLSDRFGGPSAAARQMAQGAAGFRERRLGQPAISPADDDRFVPLRPRQIVPLHPQAPAPRGHNANLVASRDAPPRPQFDRQSRPAGDPTEPLRLRRQERVLESPAVVAIAIDEDESVAVVADPRPTPYRAIGNLPGTSATDRQQVDEEERDFAEAFDAKARMRPEPLILNQAQEPDAASGSAEASGDASLSDDDRGFWQVYQQSGADWIDDQIMTDDPAPVEVPNPDCAMETAAEIPAEPSIAETPTPATASTGPVSSVSSEAEDITPAGGTRAAAPGLSIPVFLADPATEADEPAATRFDDDYSRSTETDRLSANAEEITEPATPSPDPDHSALGAQVQPANPAATSAETIADANLTDQINLAELTVRDVIRELIQEELHGELGQRFARNLRAVIRREVAAAIDDHLERL